MPRFNIKRLLSLAIVALFSATALTAPVEDISATSGYAKSKTLCKNPIKRKEWRQLTNREKSAYIQAVKCLQQKPTIYGVGTAIPGAVSRFDDFHGVHISQTMSIHFVGHFLPWHRYFVATYEKALREECHYTGAQPYWDWSIDADKGTDYNDSPIFDATTGFGGDGSYVDAPGFFVVPGHTGGGCVMNGPFVNMQVHVGPLGSLTRNDRCLTRDFAAEIIYNFANTEKVNGVLSKTTFTDFTRAVDGEPNWTAMGIHGPGHFGVGGEAGDMFSSPGEPLFYLHHANVDRIWWKWQSGDIQQRLLDIGGPVKMMDYSGPNVTLSQPITLGLLAPDITAKETMSILGGPGNLCYIY